MDHEEKRENNIQI